MGRPIEVERTYRDLLGDESEATLRLAPPVRRAELDETGAVGALMVGGTHTPVVVFQNLRVFQGGDLRLMKPTSRGLEEVRRSPLLGRAMVAAAQWRISEDHTVWAAVVWTKNGGGFTKPESRVFLLDPATGDLLTAGP